ncbi:MAG: DapH/DapD/GlmU-related protein [Candidatus Omnitrophica bacterium]|nr:DapH/DapD/GlmU-related protein [Candidatus Omnitrophota bacterium]
MKNNTKFHDMIQRDAERLKRIYNFIKSGVKVIDPLTTYIAENVKIGKGTVIYPLTVIESNVTIGKNCSIGPFARIRKGTRIKDSASIGNFVEVVRSTISKGSKVKHLTYLGDTFLEENVNIGAGTIVANYDGNKKHKTYIKKGAFIGSGSILIAPLRVGKNAITGAGAVVTKRNHVPNNAVVVGIPARILKK